MEYQEFFQRIKADLKQALPEELQNVEIGERQVDKLQGLSYYGLEIKPARSQMSMTMDLRSFYGAGVDESNYDEVLGSVATEVLENIELPAKNQIEKLVDYEAMKDTLFVQMIGKEGNEEMLAKIPHRYFEDLALVYRFKINVADGMMMSALITDAALKKYGITEEQLHEDACHNMVEQNDMLIMSMNEMLEKLTGIPASELPLNPVAVSLYVATNQAGKYGASVLEHPDFTKAAEEKLGGDFFIIPSSVHEILLLPDDGCIELEEIEAMVQEINATRVPPEERLSNTVYHYDTEVGKLETARGYEKRIEQERKSVLEALKDKKMSVSEIKKEMPKIRKAEMTL